MSRLNYRTCSLADLSATISSFDPTWIVSLIDPDMDAPRTRLSDTPRHLVLRLHDVDRIDNGSTPGNPAMHHLNDLATSSHLMTSADRVIFHCVGGRRRSTAAAMICDLSKYLRSGYAPSHMLIQDCWNRLHSDNPGASPNRALLSLADTLFDLDGILRDFNPPRYLDLCSAG